MHVTELDLDYITCTLYTLKWTIKALTHVAVPVIYRSIGRLISQKGIFGVLCTALIWMGEQVCAATFKVSCRFKLVFLVPKSSWPNLPVSTDQFQRAALMYETRYHFAVTFVALFPQNYTRHEYIQQQRRHESHTTSIMATYLKGRKWIEMEMKIGSAAASRLHQNVCRKFCHSYATED